MSFDKLLQSFRYKSARGVSAINEAIEDIGIESLYAKAQTTKNLGLFDKKVLKDEDEIRSFKTFLFNLYPDFFFVIKSINDEQIGIKVCKRVRMEKCIIETIYIDTSAYSETGSSASDSSLEVDNQSVTSEASYSTISSVASFTSIYASKERTQTYGRSVKVIEQDKKKQEAKDKAKKEQEAKDKAKKEQEQELKKKCDFFHTKNGCYHGDACRFRH
jgi:hypothetical protein